MKNRNIILAALLPTTLVACLLTAVSCKISTIGNGAEDTGIWTPAEKEIIGAADTLLRVLTVFNHDDSLILRAGCDSLTPGMIASGEYAALARRLMATVTSVEGGVGLAGPQVGISRRVVAVCRLDKPGEEFEVYPNVRIVAVRGEKEPGPEGCFSVPGCRGDVLRYRDITVRYTSPSSLKDTVEVITGYTAIIFQHECDHLDGVIFTDRID